MSHLLRELSIPLFTRRDRLRDELERGRAVRRRIDLTPFGRDFCETCLPLDTAELGALPGAVEVPGAGVPPAPPGERAEAAAQARPIGGEPSAGPQPSGR